MFIMALDHVRDFFTNAPFDPTDLSQTNAAYFLTRWITHYCAPTFTFLAGTSAFLFGQRGRTKDELSHFLWTRGLWLVFLELTVVRFGWTFNWNFLAANGGATIWAIGWSMVVLSRLIYLPTRDIAVFGLGMIFLHNALDGIGADQAGAFGWLWRILHAGGVFQLPWGGAFSASYPLIPWMGVMATGYVFGTLYTWTADRRQKWLLGIGFTAIALFCVLRGFNIYGDMRPWSPQKSVLFNLFSVLNCTKYPPSLAYLLMTLGPVMLLLWLFERVHTGVIRPLLVFGRVPTFYYVIHLIVIHAAALVVAMGLGRTDSVKFLSGNSPFGGAPADFGFNLGMVYLVWILLVLALYFPCRWFMGVKSRRKDWWLSYL